MFGITSMVICQDAAQVSYKLAKLCLTISIGSYEYLVLGFEINYFPTTNVLVFRQSRILN